MLKINKTLEKVRGENSSLFTPIPDEDIRIRREMTTNLIINIIKKISIGPSSATLFPQGHNRLLSDFELNYITIRRL